ncbi:MAG TPA: sugar ABC transporter permease [Spirochaetia bacterium]
MQAMNGRMRKGLRAVGRRLDDSFKVISIIPMILIIGVIVIYPTIYLFYLSFTDTSNLNLISGGARFVGLRNYIVQLGDKAFLTSIWNTLYFTAVSVGASTIVGLALAWLVYSMQPIAKNILVPLVLVPNIVAETACALMLKPMLDSSIGIFNYLLSLVHVAPVSYLGDKVNAQWVIMVLNVWQWVPYMFIFFLSGIESLNISYFEVARLEGASSFRLLRSIILPLIMPIVLVAVFFRVTYSLRLFDKIYVLTGGGPGNATDTITSYIQRVGILRMDFGYSSAGGVIMLLITAVIGALTLKRMYGTND